MMSQLTQLQLEAESPLANLRVVSVADRHNPDFDISDPAALDAFLASQQTHFWFASRNDAIAQHMHRLGLTPPDRILEVGCGTGTVLAELLERGFRADGIDMHLELAHRAAQNCPRATVYCLDFVKEHAAMCDADYDAVGLFDVLEHIEDPTPFLRRCADLTADAGLIIGTVPALSMLWSVVDKLSGHYRRYDRGLMRRHLEAAGLELVRASYFFQTLLVPTWLHRKRIEAANLGTDVDRAKVAHQNIRVPARPLNTVLGALCSLERSVGRVIPLGRVPGASLFFAARKKKRKPRRDSAAPTIPLQVHVPITLSAAVCSAYWAISLRDP